MAKKKKFKLKFKYPSNDPNPMIKDLDWLLRCAQSSVYETWDERSIRRKEIDTIIANIQKQIIAKFPHCWDGEKINV